MSGSCHVEHDWFGAFLGCFLLAGLAFSYLPQIVRFVRGKNSLGFSPWYLLLGVTAHNSGFFNVLSLQWGVVRCCPELGTGLCLEGLLGVLQVGLQWLLGLVVYVSLYLEQTRTRSNTNVPQVRSIPLLLSRGGTVRERNRSFWRRGRRRR